MLGVPKADRLRFGPPGPVSPPREQTDLLEVLDPLLSAGHEGEDQRSDALLRATHAGTSPRPCCRPSAGLAPKAEGVAWIEVILSDENRPGNGTDRSVLT